MANPPEIERMHQALGKMPGVTDVSSGITSLQGVTADHLPLADYAPLPHGALRRTDGGLPGEALIQFEFRLAQTTQGWRSLEFLAWFFRDQARGGAPIQLRPFALPPRAGERVQLGSTLRWHLDLFCPDTGDDLAPQLGQVAIIADGLETALRLYGDVLRPANVAPTPMPNFDL